MGDFHFQAGNVKEIGNCHSCPYNKKKLNIINNNEFSWNHQRSEIAEICRSRDIQRVTAESYVAKIKW